MKNEIDQDLLSAIWSNTASLVEGLLKAGVDGNARNQRGWTPLHVAADHYSVDAARVLLGHGAEVNARDVYGNTPLARAVYRSKGGTELELVRLLLSRGADPDIKNKNGESPRDLAKGSPNLEKLLA